MTYFIFLNTESLILNIVCTVFERAGSEFFNNIFWIVMFFKSKTL